MSDVSWFLAGDASGVSVEVWKMSAINEQVWRENVNRALERATEQDIDLRMRRGEMRPGRLHELARDDARVDAFLRCWRNGGFPSFEAMACGLACSLADENRELRRQLGDCALDGAGGGAFAVADIRAGRAVYRMGAGVVEAAPLLSCFHAVLTIDPGPGGRVRVGFDGDVALSFRSSVSHMQAIRKFCEAQGIEVEEAGITIGAPRSGGGFPVRIVGVHRKAAPAVDQAGDPFARDWAAEVAAPPDHPALAALDRVAAEQLERPYVGLNGVDPTAGH